MTEEQFGLSKEVIESIRQILAQFPEIGSVIIYGSRAKGNYKTGSDIDLTLIASKHSTLDLTTQFQLEEALDELLLPYMFDISIMENIDNPNMIDHIQRIGKSFYTR